jgi:murein DD-endopeptidase MepM/ murein hydrolase activator NlpD
MQGGDLPPPPGAPVAPAYASAGPQAYTPPSSYAPAEPQQQFVQSASVQRGAPPTTLGDEAARLPGHTKHGAGTHLVQSGDTAWNISHRYGITVEQLAAANGGSTNVRLGQRLTIPGGSGQRIAAQEGVQLASLNPKEIPPTQPAAPMPEIPVAAAVDTSAQPVEQQVAFAPQTGSAGALAPAAPAAADAAGFRWPVRGRIISGFGKKPSGERNDGINLAVPEGTSVKAAEDGTVIYAGNELKSYGNLVLIRHNGGWVSAYAHNSKLEVKRGDTVKRGQTVALSGMSGGVTTPQVHFELRKDATPVDPLQHLSES